MYIRKNHEWSSTPYQLLTRVPGVRIPWRGPELDVKSKLKLQTIENNPAKSDSFWKESPDFWLPRVCDLLARPRHSPRWPQAIATEPNRSTAAAKQTNRPMWTHQTLLLYENTSSSSSSPSSSSSSSSSYIIHYHHTSYMIHHASESSKSSPTCYAIPGSS